MALLFMQGGHSTVIRETAEVALGIVSATWADDSPWARFTVNPARHIYVDPKQVVAVVQGSDE
jgi:hypothetical protein